MPNTLRPAVRDLISALAFRAMEAQQGRPCWVMRTKTDAGLVVPVLTSSYDFLRAYRRSTVDEAVTLGYVALGDQLQDMPAYSYGGPRWSYRTCGLKGRTIALIPRCARCTEADGPFTDSELCEGCARPTPLGGVM
ncbi:hypothetical protein ACIQ7D_18090 [Streptomyces sp. NPDC096310]|uniref:hypothetical protein n=1 Tax=Streptomyces sp. NPDC096310 TaxID=3366082 RepID=UPI00380DCD24